MIFKNLFLVFLTLKDLKMYSSDDDDDEIFDYNEDETEVEEDEEVEDHEEAEEYQEEEEPEEEVEDHEEAEEYQEEEEPEEDEDNSLIDEIFDEKNTTQSLRKREFKIDKKKIVNQVNKFKFKSFENSRENIKNELYNFSSSDKNVNIFMNNIKCSDFQSWNILRNMFYNELSLKEILGEIKEYKYSYESILWDKYREGVKKEVISLQTEIEVIDSFISCPKCKQKKIQFYNVQLRRADEPPTTFNNCMNKDCLYSWRTG
uniref:TFIIS-type domain-containing protein n=1 Tax=viral metagenome TaxID=1070528 RepID=A0A6C0DKJ7_9ZZZZ